VSGTAERQYQDVHDKLLEAARILSPVPQTMQLRYFSMLFQIAGNGPRRSFSRSRSI
jgi:hypothetical protein